MKKKRIIISLMILISACSFWFWVNFRNERNDIQASGIIEAASVDLTARLAGTIKILSIEAGKAVKKDQLLVELDRNDLTAQKERDELSVLKSISNLKDLESGARSDEIKIAEADLNIVLSNSKKAEDNFERLKVLFKEGAATRVEYENAQAALNICISEVKAAESRLALLKTGNRSELINAAKMEVERNKAVLKATDAMLEDLKICSPIEGIVMSKNYELGEYVTPGLSLATVVSLDNLWIKVYIPTDDLPQVAFAQKVSFSVSGLPQNFYGVVEEIAVKGEFTPKTIQTKKERANVVFGLKVRISSEGGILKPGMPADVIFPRGNIND